MELKTVIPLSAVGGYSSIRKKLEKKKHTLQFLPQSLADISKCKNFEYKGARLKSAYLIDIVHNLILKYYFKKENRFHLMSTILKEKYGHAYNYYIDYLVDAKILILMMDYRAGKNARVYRINEFVLKNQITRYSNRDGILLKKYKNKVSQVEENGIKESLIESSVRKRLVEDLFHIEIQFDKSIFYLDNLKHDDIDIYNRNRYSVECVNDKHIFYHFDNYGRLHTNFTILKSFIRKNCLLIDGEETCEIDINNSQPLFLSKLIHDSGSKWVNAEEFNLFRYLTIEGKYYQYLIDVLKIPAKADAKNMTYKVLFGRNSPNSKADKMFSKSFPTIHNFIKLYKREMQDYRILSHELQRAESALVFNKIIKELYQSHPEIKVVTVHDSIVFAAKHKKTVEEVFRRKMEEEFGEL